MTAQAPTTVEIAADGSVALPDWVVEGLGLSEGDEVEFVKVAGREGFILQKVAPVVGAEAPTAPQLETP